MRAQTAALKGETDNYEDSEELEDDQQLLDEMEVPMDTFITRCEVIAIIDDETKKSTAAIVTKQTTNKVEDTIANVIKVGYTSAKERIKLPIFYLVEESLSMSSNRAVWTQF